MIVKESKHCDNARMNKSPSMDSADKAFSDAIRTRDNYQCRFCGAVATDCAHIVGRREKITRWDADNAITLCRDHHRYFTDHPDEFEAWISGLIGKAGYDELQRRRRMVLKVNAVRLKDIGAHYRAETRRMKKNGTRDLEPWVPYEAYALRAG